MNSGLIHYILGQWTLNRKILGTVENSSDPAVLKEIGPPKKEVVFANGMVVHALAELTTQIVGYYREGGIQKAKTERV